MKFRVPRGLLALVFLPLIAAALPTSSDLSSFDRKCEHIDRNGRMAHPDQAPTTLTESEVNAFLASREVTLPAGVRSVRMVGEAGKVTGTSQVDFDALKAGLSSSNPLLSIFSGVHEVVVEAHAEGTAGKANVHTDSVSLDGVEIPRFVLQLFVDHYITPRYPGIGLDSQFRMPNRIDTAYVGLHLLKITQK